MRTWWPIFTPSRRRASSPSSASAPMETWAAMRARRPMRAARPMTTKGPMAAPSPMSAVGSITAVGWMPGAISGPGVERAGDARHGVARTRHDERGLEPERLPVGARPEDGGARPALRETRREFGLHGECEMLGSRHRGLRGAGHADGAVAEKLGAECGRDVADGVGHRPCAPPAAGRRFTPERRAAPPRRPGAPPTASRRARRSRGGTRSRPSASRRR